MKRNYLLTLLCLLVAVLLPNEVWAECFYVSNGTGEKSTNSSGTLIYETGAFENNAGISKIEFTAKKDVSFNTSGISKVTLKYSLDGGTTWSEKDTYAITNGNGSSHSIACSSSDDISKANAFQVLTNGGTWGSYKYIISNFNVYVQSSLSVNPQEVDFGSVPVGKAEQRDVEFTYSNIGTAISSNVEAPFSVSYETLDGCPSGGVGTVVVHITYAPTEESASKSTIITFTANGQSASITATASASAVVNPTHTWKGNDKYNVGEVLDLSQLWESNSSGTITYTKTSFDADKDNEEGASTPVITNGNSIVLSQAGKLVIELSQEATTGYNALTSTQTIQISKNTGTLSHNLTNAYHIDDAANVVDCYTASNREVEVQVESSNTDVIAVVEGQLKAVGVGTATVTFKQAETYKWMELTASQEITVTKYDVSAHISQAAATWDATIDNPFAISYDLNDYTVEALDPAIATYTEGAIQTYAETGTAHFVLSRPEDYKYNQLAETLSISVAPKTESDIIYQDNTQYDINYGNSHTYTVSNVLPGDVLTVDFWENSGAQGGLAIYGYVNEAETEIMPNTEFSTTATTYTFALAKAYTSIKIQGDGGGLSIVNKHCKNFTIRRNLHISADNSNVNMESTIGTNATATISLDYGSLGSIFKVVSDNPKISVSQTSFEATGNGTQEIILTGDATVLGTETATITIYDQSKKTTVGVTCTISRIPQTISWQSGFENLDVFSTVALDATASGATEVGYSIAEGDQGKASIEGNVLSFHEAGTVRVVASAAQSEIYEGVSDTVSVVVHLAQPVVSVLPTVEPIAYGTALTDEMLLGGVAKYGESTVEGSFAWADEQITDGLTPNTYSFNVRFTPADATHYNTADCKVEVTVEKAQQAIVWQSSFENLNVLSEVSLSATAQTAVRFEVSNSEVATITGDLLTFLKAGVVDVVAIAAESDLYQQAADTIKGVVIAKIDPVVSQWPAATLTYGETLAGVVLAGESAYKGAFRWGDTITTAHLDAVKTAGVYTYQVKFVPDNGEQFNTIYGEATITIKEASQTISWENAPVECKAGDRIALEAVASSGLAVDYYVDQIGNYAMIDMERNELVALAKGAIQLRVSQGGEAGKYQAAEELVLTINIEAGNTTATEQVVATEQASVRKVMHDGVLYILRDGQCYDTCGRLVGAE